MSDEEEIELYGRRLFEDEQWLTDPLLPIALVMAEHPIWADHKGGPVCNRPGCHDDEPYFEHVRRLVAEGAYVVATCPVCGASDTHITERVDGIPDHSFIDGQLRQRDGVALVDIVTPPEGESGCVLRVPE